MSETLEEKLVEQNVLMFVRKHEGCKLAEMYSHMRSLDTETVLIDRALAKLINSGSITEIIYTIPTRTDPSKNKLKIYLVPGDSDVEVYKGPVQVV